MARSEAGLLAIGIGLTPFWFIFGNNCTLTIPPAHVAAVYDPLRGGVQNDVLPEVFHLVMPWWQTQQFSQQTQEYNMSGSTRAPAGEEQKVARLLSCNVPRVYFPGATLITACASEISAIRPFQANLRTEPTGAQG